MSSIELDNSTEKAMEAVEGKKKKINVVWDASLLDVFMTCPIKYYYRHIALREPLDLADPLAKGSLFHVGKEHYFKVLQASGDWNKAVEAGLYEMRKYSIDLDLANDDINWILETFQAESEWNRNEDLSYTIHDVEKPFMYIMYEDDNIRIVMIGKIDLVFSNKNYANVPLDHKTFDRDFGLQRRGNQFVNYSIALDSNYLFVNRVGLQKTVPKEKKFTRLPLSFDEAYKEQWKLNVIKWAYDYIQCRETNDWPENPTSCFKWNKTCDYYSICETSGSENKIYKLRTNFRSASVWDVSKMLSRRD